ncbi:MAG: hypothetical protein AB7V13_07740 [Pseudorhodoplanes sp.]|uniref:hypothetical protein n=1 Tax=Pseudorhodoplanes sp. TaxID=1934341 RepID=UPI003D0A1D92
MGAQRLLPAPNFVDSALQIDGFVLDRLLRRPRLRLCQSLLNVVDGRDRIGADKMSHRGVGATLLFVRSRAVIAQSAHPFLQNVKGLRLLCDFAGLHHRDSQNENEYRDDDSDRNFLLDRRTDNCVPDGARRCAQALLKHDNSPNNQRAADNQ